MTPTLSTRRKLWISAGGRCSICKKHLITEPSLIGSQTVIGEEAHIVSPKPQGPRGQDDCSGDLDGFENLIALCLDHHTVIDRDVLSWPTVRLRAVKDAHERAIREEFARSQQARLVLPQQEKQKPFALITSGEELWPIVAGAHSFNFGRHFDATEEEKDYLAQVYDQIKDWGELASFFGSSSEERSAERGLDELCAELLDAGLTLTARSLSLRIEGGATPPSQWRQAEVACWRYSDLLESLRLATDDQEDE